jgi:epoxyqueuosine reductase QueG
MAGLGWLGASGLMITPEHGPRVRLAAVLSSIESLPFSCSVCIKVCPFNRVGYDETKRRYHAKS